MSSDCQMKTINSCYDVKFEWMITNFSQSANLIESAPFFPIPGRSWKWVIQLEFTEPDQWHSCYRMYTRIRSLDETDISPPMKIEGRVTIENNQGTECRKNVLNITIKANSVVECFPTFENNYSLPLNFKCCFPIPGDILVLKCCAKVCLPFNSIISKNELPPPEMGKEDTRILNVIYKENSHTDFTFQFADGELRAHKAILSARSPVFEKMFEHNTQEQTNNSTTIEDFDLDEFDCFLRFLYIGTIKDDLKPDLEMFLKLYELSDKYDVKDLQRYCTNVLVTTYLNEKTVIRILKLAYLHNDSLVKSHAMEFFRHGFFGVTMTEEWKQLLRDDVSLASEVLCFVTSLVRCKDTE